MIIARSPLRITLAAAAPTCRPTTREHEGFLVAAAIDKYVYVTVMRPFSPGIYLKYSALEHVEQVADVRHPDHSRGAGSCRSCETPQIEITTLADIPAGTGLGSSGSFTTALLKALYTHRRKVAASAGAGGAGLSTSKSTVWASPSASRINTSPPSAASHASPSTRTIG